MNYKCFTEQTKCQVSCISSCSFLFLHALEGRLKVNFHPRPRFSKKYVSRSVHSIFRPTRKRKKVQCHSVCKHKNVMINGFTFLSQL